MNLHEVGVSGFKKERRLQQRQIKDQRKKIKDNEKRFKEHQQMMTDHHHVNDSEGSLPSSPRRSNRIALGWEVNENSPPSHYGREIPIVHMNTHS